MRSLLHARRNRRGTSTLEFALMLPLIMIFFIGIIQYSFFFFIDQSLQTFVTYATRSAVIEAQAGTTTFGSPSNPTVVNDTSGPNNTSGFGTLLEVTPVLNPKQLTLTISQATSANGTTVITATASYPWRLPLPATTGTLTQTSTFQFAN